MVIQLHIVDMQQIDWTTPFVSTSQRAIKLRYNNGSSEYNAIYVYAVCN